MKPINNENLVVSSLIAVYEISRNYGFTFFSLRRHAETFNQAHGYSQKIHQECKQIQIFKVALVYHELIFGKMRLQCGTGH